MKRKKELQEAAETPVAQAEAESLTKAQLRRARKRAREKEEVAAAAAVAKTEPKKKAPLSKAEKKAHKKAKKNAAKLANKGSLGSKKARKAAGWKANPGGLNAEPVATKEPDVAEEEPITPYCQTKDDSLTVFVGGFPFETTEATLRQDFEECGEVTRFVTPTDAEGKRRGIAYVTFKTQAGVDAACKFDRTDYGGRLLMVNRVGPPKKNGKGEKGDGKGPNAASFDYEVSVRGLPFSTTSAELKTHFEQCGDIVNLKLLYNDEGKVRGSAFIAFKNEDGLIKALVRNETEYGGRTMHVTKSADWGKKQSQGKDGESKGKGKGKGKNGKA